MFTLPGKSGTYICIYIYITYPLFLGWSRPQFFWQKNKHDHSLGISSSPKNHPIPMDKTLRIVTSSSFRIPRCTKRCRSLGGNLIHSTKVMWFKMDDLESAEKSYSKKVTCLNLFWDLALLYSQVYAHQLLHYLSYQRQANCCLWCDDGWDTSCNSHDNSAGLVSYASELQVFSLLKFQTRSSPERLTQTCHSLETCLTVDLLVESPQTLYPASTRQVSKISKPF